MSGSKRTAFRKGVGSLLIGLLLAVGAGGCMGDDDDKRRDNSLIGDRDVPKVPRSSSEAPNVGKKREDAISDSRLETAAANVQRGERPPRGVQAVGEQLRVEVLSDRGDRRTAEAAIQRLGGRVEETGGQTLVQALVPASRIDELEDAAGVSSVRAPLISNAPNQDEPAEEDPEQATPGQELAKTRAGAWHAAGITGAGVKVGIIDSFSGTKWTAAQGQGDLPAPAGTFCRQNGAACDIWGSGSAHGSGVAEIIHEMAPGATLYVASARTTPDHQAAVDYFAANGVQIISRSLTAEYDGRGNGTGALAEVVNSAVARGMTWFNSAGNSAGRGGGRGAYWRGQWNDPDGDGWLNFNGTDELQGYNCAFLNGLRWSDWGTNRTDYDLFLYDDEGATVEDGRSANDQLTGNYGPLEHALPKCSSQGEVDWFAIKLDRAGGGTAGDVLEFMTNGYAVEYQSNAYSAGGPASDSANPGALSVGAVDPAMGTTIGEYSAEGPTNDGRMKPDISAASCVTSVSYSPSCFGGTSAATPVAAGAAALVMQSGRATTPAALKTFLTSEAASDRGVGGPDNVFGSGELVLPPPRVNNERRIDPIPPEPPKPPDPVPGDETAPVISTFLLSPAKFKAAKRGASAASAVGTSVRYRLSEPAIVTLRAERCTRRRGKRCARYSRVPGSIVRGSIRGLNRFGFSGRLRGKLRVGTYRLVARAADQAGNVSTAEAVDFRVVAR